MACLRLKLPSGHLILGCLFLTLFIPSLLSAQSIFEQVGRLPVTVYTNEEYGGDPSVLASIQSEEGLMYFGTATGIHEYDGVSWRSLFKSNELIGILSFAKDNTGRIFYTGQDFGFLEADSKGETRAVSLLHLIPEELRSNFVADEIHFWNGSILLRTRDHHLIQLALNEDLTLKSLKSWQAETRFGKSFLVEDQIYVQQAERGLYRLEGDGLKMIPGTDIFGKERLSAIHPYSKVKGNSLLLGAAGTGFYLYEDGVLTRFPTEVNNTLNSATTHKGNYFLSIYGAGIVMMNQEGEIIKRISTDQGLPSDIVYSVYFDQTGGLWATTDDGMARIAINTPILSFGKESGIDSRVRNIQKVGDQFYLGTSTGLLKFDIGEKKFKAALQTASLLYDSWADGEDLIIANSGNLELIRDGKTIRFYQVKEGNRAQTILIPKSNPNLLLVGATNGLMVYQRGLSKEYPWEYRGNVPGVESVGTILYEDKDGKVISGNGENLFVLDPKDIGLETDDPTKMKVAVFETNRLETRYSLIDGEFYISSSEGMLKYSSKEGEFVATEDFSAIEKDIFDFNQDKSGIIWYESLDKKKYILNRDAEGKFVRDERPNSIAPYLSTEDFIDEDSIMWFGTPKGLVRYDPKKDNQSDKKFFTLIRRIETKTDTIPLLFYGRKKDIAAVERKENSYRFEFAAPYFEEEKKTKYQTYLEGFDPEWVDWNDNKFKEYTNLSPGTYTFYVRAMAYTGRVSEEAAYSFVVLPPWFATWWAYLLYALLMGGIITAIVKWRSQKLKAENRILEERVNERTAELEKSLTELKATQAQLIQSEKMASLGELTAGIAHEIQNPLNFVNNFSEVSKELLAEMKEELATGSKEEAEAIADDVIQNLEKIHHHGKRADAIVKGMLQHSRTGSGKKELTDLNALSDEYLRLAYHGLRAKDKSFQADFKTDLDPNLPKLEVMPQDMGRVLLNLINNAFYAVNEKRKKLLDSGDTSYKPMVKVKTQSLENAIEIAVMDNGDGIPESVKSKIFQPFFTTKPTGQGTGLGLSLSYDIVKAHRGELDLDSIPGESTQFRIILPLK
ncbi:ATP-binding protein [Shivajiella indica]|uniref:histidine kinase n=1 Tax=Shivajiella indica TaxID=872115 RepID=A0ABW5B6Y8_9BACT